MHKVYAVDVKDVVATALTDLPAGTTKITGSISGQITVLTPLKSGHKVALQDIRKGGDIIKYGVVIGQAIEDINKGDWVHLHNIKSLHDTRSASGIDPETGKAVDTKYD